MVNCLPRKNNLACGSIFVTSQRSLRLAIPMSYRRSNHTASHITRFLAVDHLHAMLPEVLGTFMSIQTLPVVSISDDKTWLGDAGIVCQAEGSCQCTRFFQIATFGKLFKVTPPGQRSLGLRDIVSEAHGGFQQRPSLIRQTWLRSYTQECMTGHHLFWSKQRWWPAYPKIHHWWKGIELHRHAWMIQVLILQNLRREKDSGWQTQMRHWLKVRIVDPHQDYRFHFFSEHLSFGRQFSCSKWQRLCWKWWWRLWRWRRLGSRC